MYNNNNQTFIVLQIPKKQTAVKPFVFHLDSRLSVRDAKREEREGKEKNPEEYVPTAEYVFKFQTKTPERFRTTSRRSHLPVPASADETARSSQIETIQTFPQTPNLQTKARARPTTVKSSTELEEEELAQLRR